MKNGVEALKANYDESAPKLSETYTIHTGLDSRYNSLSSDWNKLDKDSNVVLNSVIEANRTVNELSDIDSSKSRFLDFKRKE